MNYLGFALTLLAVGLSLPAQAQKITHANYMRFVPTRQPRIIRQTDPTRALGIYGNAAHPQYVDADSNGIDDSRDPAIQRLVSRFSPALVRNTWMRPVAVEDAFSLSGHLFIDTWDLSRSRFRRIARDSVSADVFFGRPDLDNGILEVLLSDLDPTVPRPRVGEARPDLIRMAYLDLPGHGPGSWQRAFQKPARTHLRPPRTYAHLFVDEVHDAAGDGPTFELVVQYWFYFPYNDSVNNHEGDWEHLNVVVAIRDTSGYRTRLSAGEIDALFGSSAESAAALDATVIGRVDYYFHHFTLTLDYLSPNVYLPLPEWQREVRRTRLRGYRKWLAGQLRTRAMSDGRPETHPVGYIGGDFKGLNQVSWMPGARARDSHGLYPFAGVWKDIGTVGVSEVIRDGVDGRRGDDRWVRFEGPGQVEVLPDWENLHPLIASNARARGRWSWMILPMRWGFPATDSPFAGIIPNADTGNLGPVGPTYNSAWNRQGACQGYSVYDPRFYGHFQPLSLHDNFSNRLGFLNLTAPVVIAVTPLDFLRLAFNAVFRRTPLFSPSSAIPLRHFGIGVGISPALGDADFARLLPSDGNPEVGAFLTANNAYADYAAARHEGTFRPSNWMVQYVSHIGRRFASESVFRHSRSRVSYPVVSANRDIQVATVAGDMVLIEYANGLRLNLKLDRFRPYLRAGYGYSVYRVRNVTLDGAELQGSLPGRWTHKPGFPYLPNTFNLGVGIEFVPTFQGNLRRGRSPTAWDYGLKVEAVSFWHRLGITGQGNRGIRRDQINVLSTISF